MNVIHMKYAVEVAKAGSINKASEVLHVAQPNLSRSIKELEADLGITIFSRTSKGMTLTPKGEEFMGYAQNILRQLDEVEMMYKSELPAKQIFSVSVPRASYIADAFAKFSNCIGEGSAEIYYQETNSNRAIINILEHNYNLGIIRYASHFDNYFKTLLDECQASAGEKGRDPLSGSGAVYTDLPCRSLCSFSFCGDRAKGRTHRRLFPQHLCA